MSKLNKGYGFLRRKKCFGQMDVCTYLPCKYCSTKERNACYEKTFGDLIENGKP